MKRVGALTFVLHTHIPYARSAGRWPHGEEWLHEAALESYIPLLNTLYNLAQDQIPVSITLTLSPVLVEQLADPDIQRNFRDYLDEKIQAAESDVARFHSGGESIRSDLAEYYLAHFNEARSSFLNRFEGDLVAAFRRLQEAGRVEIATCAATHGYLPLLARDESIHLQLRTAVESYQRHFGCPPRIVWLPECAYRPRTRTQHGRYREGLETFLEQYDLRMFFAEARMIETGLPLDLPSRRELQNGSISTFQQVRARLLRLFGHRPTTYRPYLVGASSVAVVGRNRQVGEQVWSAASGYPGDSAYREFHKKDDVSGLQYWRVTGPDVDLGEKDIYDPVCARERVRVHTAHFAKLVDTLMKEHAGRDGEFGVVSANYDTELFGHWWFEGVDWLEGVLRRTAESDQVDVTDAWSYLEDHPPSAAVRLPEGSWGEGGRHQVWDNEETHWMWPLIHAAEKRMQEVTSALQEREEKLAALMNQAARELLLLQSSDWPFLVTTGQARDYAEERFRQHLGRFQQLLDAAEREEPVPDLVQELWEKDKIFPEIDYRWFQA